MNSEPAVKWSGSKRKQAKEILKYFPKSIDTYYEPFLGGASVLYALMQSDIQVNRYLCSDINEDLINLFKFIKDQPLKVSEHYAILWHELNIDEDLERKKQYFIQVRERLNKEHNPLDFMFIMRTTTNGMPRYNKNGEFNNSFHITRKGIQPEKLKEIVLMWSLWLNKSKVEFYSCPYSDIKPNSPNDFMYLDPPYVNTKGMYFGTIDYSSFFKYLRSLPCAYALSLDGVVNDCETGSFSDMTEQVSIDIYTKHMYINSGNSSFRRVLGKSKRTTIQESLYIKRGETNA